MVRFYRLILVVPYTHTYDNYIYYIYCNLSIFFKFEFSHTIGVTVYTPTYILNQSEVVIMFSSGAGVEVVENAGHMTARVFLPWTFIVIIFIN